AMTSTRPVAIFPSRIWGPRPRWAIVPLAGAVAVVAPLLARPDLPPGAVATVVTAFKPLADGSAVRGPAPAAIPLEAAYGVPTPATLHLWLPDRSDEAPAADAG
ncbi:MAG: hypothetical protein ACKO3G_16355, partial [Planctomycetaceae bacterium]